MRQKRSPFQIVLTDHQNKFAESYRVTELMFNTIRKMIEPFRSVTEPSKAIRCIETGEIFKNAAAVALWLQEKGLTKSYTADYFIKSACKGMREHAYGYHWEYVKPN